MRSLLALALLAGCSKSPPPPPAPAPATATAASPAASPAAAAPAASSAAAPAAATDTLPTARGPLGLRPIHHASTLFTFGGKAIYLDPAKEGSYAGLPRADYIFVSDIHGDHFDPDTIASLRQGTTVVVGPAVVAEKMPGLVVLKNGDQRSFDTFSVEAVPMYNVQRGPEPGKLFHDKGRGNGYVFTFGDQRVYASGDTECTAEMRALSRIDVALVCMNLPYTMTPGEAAECVRAFRPKVVYPYHFKGQNLDDFTKALQGESGIEVRRRTWY